MPTRNHLSMVVAFRRVAPIAFLGVVPAIILTAAAILAVRGGNLGVDFHWELYPEAKLLLHGTSPFPQPDADLMNVLNRRILPIPAALLVSPLTILSVGAASAVFCAILLLALVATIRVLGVTDWRIYGVVACCSPTIAALQTGNVTILLALLVAIAWRYQERRFLPGLAIGLAIALKLFLWPLGIWLLARRRFASTGAAAAVAAAGTLLVLPFTALGSYERLMSHLGDTFGPHSVNILGLLSQSGVGSRGVANALTYTVGLTVLTLAYRRRSVNLAIAASLVLSPIVWLHYFVLLFVPLAISRPRFTAVWLIPIGFWLCPGSGADARTSRTAIALCLFIIVTVLSEWPELATRLRSAGRGRVTRRVLEHAAAS